MTLKTLQTLKRKRLGNEARVLEKKQELPVLFSRLFLGKNSDVFFKTGCGPGNTMVRMVTK